MTVSLLSPQFFLYIEHIPVVCLQPPTSVYAVICLSESLSESPLQYHQKFPPGYFLLLLMSLFLFKCIYPLLFILFHSFHVIYIHGVFCTSVLLLAKTISIICSNALKSFCGLAAVLERDLIFKFYSVCGFFSSISTFSDCSVWFGFIYSSIVELFVFLKPSVENKSVWQLEVATFSSW